MSRLIACVNLDSQNRSVIFKRQVYIGRGSAVYDLAIFI